MAAVSKTRNLIEGFVKDGSFKWLLKNRNPFHEEFEEMKASPSAEKNWIYELSPVANIVVRRCSKILKITTGRLQEDFNGEATDAIKDPSCYARNLLEYSCFRALSASTQVSGYMEDKKFRRLTFDMMLAWEVPDAASQPTDTMDIDEDASVGIEAFSRIAPAVPIIADVIVCDYIFEFLTGSSGGRLQFSTFEKYLTGLERAVRKLKSQSESSLLSPQRSERGERILEIDGTVTTQPVLQHVGISTWPGRLTLTDHAMYFEALRVVSYDKPTVYELADDLKQFVKPELTGPWGTRLFDKAFLYKSLSLSDPVVMELPELKGHSRRDYWLAIIREILYAHRFIRKFQITGVEKEETLLKAVFGITRVQALKEMMTSALPLSFEAGLMFNACDQLPGGDRILETLATTQIRKSNTSGGMSASTMASNLGSVFGKTPDINIVGDVSVGELTPLQKAVKESRSTYKMVASAQATVDGVKVQGIDTNLAVMKELLFPVTELGNRLVKLFYWEDPLRSLTFCLVFTYVIYRGWFSYVMGMVLGFMALFIVITRWCSRGRGVDEFRVVAPPPMNTMEQLLAIQNAISQAEEVIQDANILLLKLRGLLLSIFPQASDRFAVALVMMGVFVAVIPLRYVILVVFVEEFTKYSALRRPSTERWNRRVREWWFSIPAAPVVLEKPKDDKKNK